MYLAYVLYIELLHEYSYIQHGCFGNRNKFPRCQCEPFIGCSNDEDQTALKWDRGPYPVAAPGRETHSLSLKYSDNVIMKLVSWMSVIHLRGHT